MIIALVAAASAQDATDGHALALGTFGDPNAPFWRAWTPVSQRPGELSGAAAFEYASHVLGTGPNSAVPSLMALNWRVDYAPIAELHVSVSGPLFLGSDDRLGGEGYSAPALGDLRLSAGARTDVGEASGVGVEGSMILPSGPEGRLLGAPGVGWSVRGVGHGAMGALHGLASLGVDADELSSNPQVRGGTYLGGTAGVAYELVPSGLDALQFSLEAAGRLPIRTTAVGETPVELTLGARGRLGENVFGLAFSKALGGGQPSADWRVLLAYGRKFQTKADTDDDLIIDARDTCRADPERMNFYQDEDGCPDRLGVIDLSVMDTLGRPVAGADVLFGDEDAVTGPDGHVTLPDVMPRSRAVIAVRHPAYNDGVAILDSVPDADILVPVLVVPKPVPFEIRLRGPNLEPLSGIVRLIGPVKVPTVGVGMDGDETVALVPGEWRAVISADGYGVEERSFQVDIGTAEARARGDLDAGGIELIVTQVARTEVTPTQIAISGTQIRFRTGSATLESESMPLVAEIAERLINHPEVRLIEIQGHTDNVGEEAANLKLSQDRVDMVRSFLLAWGVEPARVRTVGFGEGVPLDANDTEEGRARNRRVSFVIIERDATK